MLAVLDYKLLQAFAMVIQEAGFEKASARIHITQSAISQRVKHLEDQLGQILLLRTTPPKATQAGKKVLKLYNQVTHLEDDFKTEVDPDGAGVFTSLPVGVNADTLDTWLFGALHPFLQQENVGLDLHLDDQDRTHRFLRDGKVLACISTRDKAIQGCRIEYIGEMVYGLYCSKPFAGRWFPDGLNLERLKKAPVLCFNRDDELNATIFQQIFNQVPTGMPVHYIPSSTLFIRLLKSGIAYGVLPEQQSRDLVQKGQIIDLAPTEKVMVRLYWHCWNLDSRLLKKLTKALLKGFRETKGSGFHA